MCYKQLFCAFLVLQALLNIATAYHGFFPGPRHEHTPDSQPFRRQAPPSNFQNNGFSWDNSGSAPNQQQNNLRDRDAIFFPNDVDSDQPNPWGNQNNWGNPNPWGRRPWSNQNSWNNQNNQNNQNPTPSPIATSTVAIPGMGTPRTPCEDACQVTPEYNPVCGNDGITYFNERRLTCAQNCGKRVRATFRGRCVNQG